MKILKNRKNPQKSSILENPEKSSKIIIKPKNTQKSSKILRMAKFSYFFP
jgi:hypothetical protein